MADDSLPSADVVLRTERLCLRAPEPRDHTALVAGCRDPEVARFIPLIPVPYTDTDGHEWLAGEPDRRAKGEFSFAITEPPDDTLLGVITVRLRRGGSLGYWLTPDARGRGMMSEAARAVVRWAGDAHGIDDLWLTAHPDNLASQRVAAAIGFTSSPGLLDHEPPFRDGQTRARRFDQRPRGT